MASPAYRNWLMCRKMRGRDHLVDAILDGYVESSVVKECKDIYEDKVTRLYVEACLLSSEDFEEMSEVLGISEHTLMVYHDIYYDVHSLSRILKTRHLSKIEDNDERKLKQWAIANGIDFIKWRLGLTSHNASTLDQLKRLQADAFFRSKEAFFNPNTSAASAEGLKWSRLASTLTKQIMDLESGAIDEAADELRLELEKINEDNINLMGLSDLE